MSSEASSSVVIREFNMSLLMILVDLLNC